VLACSARSAPPDRCGAPKHQPSTFAQFGYDTASRLSSVTNGLNVVTYGYLANSPLVETVTFSENTAPRMTTTKSYDVLNRLTSISSVPSAAPVVSFNYGYNAAHQRTAVANADNSRWAFGYDTLGQVTSARKYWSDGTPVAGQQFEYAFDDLGNRTGTKAGGNENGANLQSAKYTVNNLNQYTSRDVPGAVDVIGFADPAATAVWPRGCATAKTSALERPGTLA